MNLILLKFARSVKTLACWCWVLLGPVIFPSACLATTYSVINYPYSWVDAATHTKLGPVTGGIYSASYKFTGSGGCGSAPPILDDTISDVIPLGFSFTYGNKTFTSVRVNSNGRLQFDNNTCGFGSPVTQLPYPIASLDYSMRIYGNDLDPTLKSEVSGYSTNCTSRSSCYVSYKSLGTSPNRSFVVTWNNVPEWAAANSATGSYNLQLIVKENGEFIFQFGSSVAGPNATAGQIGWQLNTSDYAVAGTGFPATGSAYLFYVPGAGSMTLGAFNAFDTSTWVGSTTGVIQTKIAGTPFTLDVVALTNTPSVQTMFSGTVKVELVDGNSAASCSAMTAIQTVTSSYNFVTGDSGRHTFSNITQANVYPKVYVRISYPATSSTKTACSTDAFTIRPDNFVVAATDSNWTMAGTGRTLNAATAAATPTHKAGQPFTLTLTAYNSAGVVTTNYSGSPTASVSCVLPATACVAGVVNVGAFSFSSGVAVSNTASYSEVGAISLLVTDSLFAQVDVADGSTASQYSISSTATTVGRFVPDHFDVTLNTPMFQAACGSFSYIGQALSYVTRPVASVAAKNSAGVTTQNYTGSLWKISPTNTSYGITPSYSEASQPLTVLNSSVPTVVDNGNGTGSLNFADTTSNILGISRAATIAPFNAEIALSFSLQDTDTVQVGNINGVAGVNPVKFGAASASNGIAFSGGNKTQRWGRLVISNAHGSELNALPVPLFSEYYNGTAFVSNTLDNCTAINLISQLSLSNPVTASGAAQLGNKAMTISPAGTSSATLANSPLLAGLAGLSFSAPGANNTGYINISANFASLPWLLFDWDHNGVHNNSPSARATFGVYKGNSQQIYLREVY